MGCQLSKSDVNHLYRLLGWVAGEVGKSPDELMETIRKIAPAIVQENGEPSEYAKNALVEMHRESVAVPKYIRAAIKALQRAIKEHIGEIVDVENIAQHKRIPHRKQRLLRNR